MKLIRKLLDYKERDKFRINIFTANSVLVPSRLGPLLVMGGGAALAAKRAYPDSDALLGEAILKEKDESGDYGYIEVTDKFGDILGALQAKRHFWDPSPIDLIEWSSKKLAERALEFPSIQYHTNCPGIGLGGLKEEDVLPILEDIFPGNVTVYV
jgi:hypothetical protein